MRERERETATKETEELRSTKAGKRKTRKRGLRDAELRAREDCLPFTIDCEREERTNQCLDEKRFDRDSQDSQRSKVATESTASF